MRPGVKTEKEGLHLPRAQPYPPHATPPGCPKRPSSRVACILIFIGFAVFPIPLRVERLNSAGPLFALGGGFCGKVA